MDRFRVISTIHVSLSGQLTLGDLIVGVGTLVLAGFTWRLAVGTSASAAAARDAVDAVDALDGSLRHHDTNAVQRRDASLA